MGTREDTQGPGKEGPRSQTKATGSPVRGETSRARFPETWSAESGTGSPQRSNPTRGGGVPGASSGSRAPAVRPARGPRAGMHRVGSRWRVGGWVARERAAEPESSRDLPPEELQGPAVSLETCWPMTAAEAVYGGGASPWQQEKPSERLLNAGPRAVGAQRSAVGRGGARRRAPAEPSSWGRRAAGGGRNFFQNLPLAGCALSQVRGRKGCGPLDGRASGPAGYPVHRSPSEVVGPVK